MKLSLVILSLFMAQVSWGKALPQGPSPEILEKITKHNQILGAAEAGIHLRMQKSATNVVPFSEHEKTGYIFFSVSDSIGNSEQVKALIAQNLPKDVTLVVYSSYSGDLSTAKQTYSRWLEPDRLITLKVPASGNNDFWSRDNLPLPVWTDGQFTLVDAKYYYNFEPDDFLAQLFSTITTKNPYFYEGGNFMANSRGECLVINRKKSYWGGTSDTAAIPDRIFNEQYGCKKLTRFKHLKGIGHADEVIKFMTDDIVVTDTSEYVDTLKSLGYEVRLLPEAGINYETYVNSLIVNDVLFMPTFGESTDQEAYDVYNNLTLGLKIVKIPTRSLALDGQGGIHCITMNYPPVPFSAFLPMMVK